MIHIKDISFSYGKNKILDNISLDIESGKCIAIIGSNGCGKSTFLTCVAGIRKPKKGKIISDNKEQIGFVPQENPLMPDLSGYDNMLLWFKGTKKELNKKLDTPLISSLGIKEFMKKPIKNLSGGMKKKISIAMALINDPALMIMDEPGAALDLPSKAEIDGYLKEYIKNGGSIIITTHDESELELCDEIYILKHGKLNPVPADIRGEKLLKELTK